MKFNTFYPKNLNEQAPPEEPIEITPEEARRLERENKKNQSDQQNTQSAQTSQLDQEAENLLTDTFSTLSQFKGLPTGTLPSTFRAKHIENVETASAAIVSFLLHSSKFKDLEQIAAQVPFVGDSIAKSIETIRKNSLIPSVGGGVAYKEIFGNNPYMAGAKELAIGTNAPNTFGQKDQSAVDLLTIDKALSQFPTVKKMFDFSLPPDAKILLQAQGNVPENYFDKIDLSAGGKVFDDMGSSIGGIKQDTNQALKALDDYNVFLGALPTVMNSTGGTNAPRPTT